jgi:hypothetical protein
LVERIARYSSIIENSSKVKGNRAPDVCSRRKAWPARRTAPASLRKPSGVMVAAPSMKAGRHHAGFRIGMENFGADTGVGRGVRGLGLMGAVDVFLGAVARQTDTDIADPENEIGQVRPAVRPRPS